MFRSIVMGAMAGLNVLLPAFAGAATADTGQRISGPYVHENLAVYLVHGKGTSGPVPLTLQEAMAKGAVVVHETGSVNQLQIENTGTEEVFVQAGDLVKGGKQDRVLTVSLLLAPKSGKLAIGSFCVEQGRWAARGREDVARFASAAEALPSREAKLAMMAPRTVAAAAPPAAASVAGDPQGRVAASPPPNVQQQRTTAAIDETGARQKEMWDNVKKMQDKLSGSLGGPVAAVASQSSLQLSLENERLKTARAGYVTALEAAGTKDDDVLGLVTAINGRLVSADLYPSNGLFRKMWAKSLSAAATEAIGEKAANAQTPPTIEGVKAFLEAAEKGKSSERTIAGNAKLEVRDGDKSLYTEARKPSGAFVHRSYLAKH
jgi:hypothetical protein